MMRLTVQRKRTKPNHTFGAFFINGEFACWTLEDEFRQKKVHGETRIPAGVYNLELRTEGGFHQRYLKRFGPEWHKGMLWLRNVPNFKYVLIHILNTEKETDGCIGVGAYMEGDRLVESTTAYKFIYPPIRDALLAGEAVTITVKNTPGDVPVDA